jgi:hypothetical protein
LSPSCAEDSIRCRADRRRDVAPILGSKVGAVRGNDLPHSPFLQASASPLFSMSLMLDSAMI